MASNFQEKVFHVLSCIGCTRISVTKDKTGAYSLSYTWGLRAIIYFICHLNFLLKFSFVLLLSFGAFEPVTEFFDWIAILLWFLIIFMILTSERLFYKIHPFFEILCAGWKLQNEFYTRLNNDQDFKNELKQLAKSRVILQTWIAILGSAAMMFQYSAAPKYCVFTYSAIQLDTYPLYILFGAHELLFIFHGWQFYGGIIYVSSCFGAELRIYLSTLRKAMITARTSTKRIIYSPRGLDDNATTSLVHDDYGGIWEISKPRRKASGSKPHSNSANAIIMEYRKLIIFSDQLNNYASYNFITIHFLAYCQMISDVFVMIQLLRMPETDIVSVSFFAEDAGVCMFMLFKVFKSMSFVSYEAKEFLQEVQVYMRSNKLTSVERRILQQTLKSLRVVSMQIGPSRIGPGMVGTSIMALVNYYIIAALW